MSWLHIIQLRFAPVVAPIFLDGNSPTKSRPEHLGGDIAAAAPGIQGESGNGGGIRSRNHPHSIETFRVARAIGMGEVRREPGGGDGISNRRP
jgi:hypothetical protein